MVVKSILKENLLSLTDIFAHLSQELLSSFDVIAEIFTQTIEGGHTVFWCGNGGSAAESSHLAAELIGRFKSNRKALPSISLSSDLSVITCIANDFGYEKVFSRQLSALAKKGDILIVLSTSGESKNIVEVLSLAKQIQIKSIAFLGNGGGQASKIADFSIIIDSSETARIQEMHLLLGHTLCEYAEIKMKAML
jgi:D-sedoheptulose 7-phosphate isomerase